MKTRRSNGHLALCVALVLGHGCKGGDDTSETSDTTDTDTDVDPIDTTVEVQPGDGSVSELEPRGDGTVDLAFDSALSPDGTEIFYVSRIDDAHQLFKIDAQGATSQLTSGAGFVLPLGVVTDGATVYVLDSGWEDASGRSGAILTTSATGVGAPAVLSGSEGYAPVGADLVSGPDRIVFTGRNVADGQPGLFAIPTSGGAVTPIATGAPFVSPSGVTVREDRAWVSDSVAGAAESGAIVEVTISTGVANLRAEGIVLGTPGGVALSPDGSSLLVSALSVQSETTVVYRYDVATWGVLNEYAPANIAGNRESAGLHCARDTERCVWANAAASDAGGEVYFVYLASNPR